MKHSIEIIMIRSAICLVKETQLLGIPTCTSRDLEQVPREYHELDSFFKGMGFENGGFSAGVSNARKGGNKGSS